MDTPMGASSVAVPLTHQLSASGLHGSLSYRKGSGPCDRAQQRLPSPSTCLAPAGKANPEGGGEPRPERQKGLPCTRPGRQGWHSASRNRHP